MCKKPPHLLPKQSGNIPSARQLVIGQRSPVSKRVKNHNTAKGSVYSQYKLDEASSRTEIAV